MEFRGLLLLLAAELLGPPGPPAAGELPGPPMGFMPPGPGPGPGPGPPDM